MPLFSENDINEAKKRVMEMQNRASNFVGRETGTSEPQGAAETPPKNPDTQNGASPPEGNDDNSLFIILALILILSRENADNKLILALLYLLL